MNATKPPTLEDFSGWLSEIHDATRENISAATDRKAHSAHLDSFSRTRAALNLLGQFKAAHPTSPSADSADSEHPNRLAKMTEQRKTLCLQAAWEIDAIARTLPSLADSAEDECVMRLVVRAMAGRLMRLTGVLMDGLGENTETTEDLARIVMLDGGQG